MTAITYIAAAELFTIVILIFRLLRVEETFSGYTQETDTRIRQLIVESDAWRRRGTEACLTDQTLLWEEHLARALKGYNDKKVAKSLGISMTTLRKALKGKNLSDKSLRQINHWWAMEKRIIKSIRPGRRF